jgi:hypothetical protein
MQVAGHRGLLLGAWEEFLAHGTIELKFIAGADGDGRGDVGQAPTPRSRWNTSRTTAIVGRAMHRGPTTP